jgi:hypothetical protein
MANYKVSCPNSKRHKRFSVTAHVAQEWQVDENGEFKKVLNQCSDTVHWPQKDDYFICMICDAEATVE